jgi:membrane protein implicated in regulation of membrane protease activity
MQTLNTIYLVFIVLGIALPVISLVFGGLDTLLSGFDLDAGEGVLPFNFDSALFSLVVVGSIGRLCNTALPWPLGLAIAVACGVGAYFLFYKFLIKPLKKNDPRAMSTQDALFQEVQVCTRIPVGEMGEVRLLDSTGSKITYLCRYEFADFEPIAPVEVGTTVKVLDIEDKVLVVGRIF